MLPTRDGCNILPTRVWLQYTTNEGVVAIYYKRGVSRINEGAPRGRFQEINRHIDMEIYICICREIERYKGNILIDRNSTQ